MPKDLGDSEPTEVIVVDLSLAIEAFERFGDPSLLKYVHCL